MAMSGGFDAYSWTGGNGKLYHRFEWSAKTNTNTYKTTVDWSIKILGNNTDWVRMQAQIIISADDGSQKVNQDSGRVNGDLITEDDGTVHGTLLSGSFTLDHSYKDGEAPSFSVHIEDVIFNGWYYRGTYEEDYTVDKISVGNPSISSIVDNGNNTITVDYEYGSNLTGNKGYLKIRVDNNNDGVDDIVTFDLNDYSEEIDKSKDTTTKITINLDDIKNISKSGIKAANTMTAIFYQYTGGDILKESSIFWRKQDKVYYYSAPTYPTNLGYSTDNKYGKYTPTSKITFSWNKPSSGCDGYRIRIYVNGSSVKIINNGYYLDRIGGDNTIYTIDCTALGINVGDKVQIGLYAYSLNGKNQQLWSGSGMTQVYSNDIIIIPDKNFIAHAKINGVWKKVELIHTKFNNSYQEVENIYNN